MLTACHSSFSQAQDPAQYLAHSYPRSRLLAPTTYQHISLPRERACRVFLMLCWSSTASAICQVEQGQLSARLPQAQPRTWARACARSQEPGRTTSASQELHEWGLLPMPTAVEAPK